jgi:hypothetical protein
MSCAVRPFVRLRSVGALLCDGCGLNRTSDHASAKRRTITNVTDHTQQNRVPARKFQCLCYR